MTARTPVGTARHWRVPAGRVLARATTAAAGDFAVDGGADGAGDGVDEPLAARRRLVHPAPWTWLRQVHGADVVVVERPGDGAGRRADAAVTTAPGCPLAVTTADCAPLVLVAEAGVGVVHAGWRGAEAGVVEAAAGALRDIGGGRPVASWLGPCISPAAYEFGEADLARLRDRFGPSVVGRTATGRPALDLRAVVRQACRAAGWPPPADPPCTSDPRWFSHRTRGDAGRQATVAWLEAVGP